MPHHKLIPSTLLATSIVLICLLSSGCGGNINSTSDLGASSTPVPTGPMPDLSAMVKRVATQGGCKDFTAEMRMTSEDQSGKRDRVEFRIQRKYASDRVSTFLTLLAPSEETDKAFLAIEWADKPTEAFTYLAGLKKLTKLNSDKQLNFRGAKVTVQELLGMELNRYTLGPGERTNDGREPLIKVEFKEKPDFGLAFPSIIGLFREKDQQPMRFDLYDAGHELQKTAEVEEVKQIQNRWTITRVTIEDLQQKLKLKLETRKIEYDLGLPDKIFTENYLKSFISDASHKLDQSR